MDKPEHDARRSPARAWADFDQITAAAMDDPHTMLHQLRAACPMGHSEKYGGQWAIVSHAGVTAAARDAETFRSGSPGPGFPVFATSMPMIGSDPPLHRDFRLPFQARFSPGSAEAMRPHIQSVVTGLINTFIERGSADLAKELCIPLPARIAGELLDLPEGNRAELSQWSARIVAEGPESSAYAQLAGFVSDLYDARLASPGTDLASMALTCEIAGQPITREDWVLLVLMLILAGMDTTSNGGALMLHYLAINPDTRAKIVAHPDQLESAVEELLRLTSPVPQHARGVGTDTEFLGQHLKSGDVVLLHWMAANRDPAVFPDPDTFDINRKPNRHYAFGFGAHRCLGANLARVELQVLIQEVLRRLPDYEVVPAEVVRYPGLNRGMSGLGARFTPGSPEDAER
jgi:cytochrome P450